MHFPLFLTMLRLVLSITLLPFTLMYNETKYGVIISSLLFLFLASTDFLDGYYARKHHLETQTGKVLDPIADKFLITTTIVCLNATNRFPLFFAIVLIIREIAMLSLRQYAAEAGIRLSVSKGGKIKTTFQCIALFLAILTPPQSYFFILIRNFFISIATFFSLSSFIEYIYIFSKKIKE